VVCVAIAASSFALSLASSSLDYTRMGALAVGMILVLTIVMEGCSEVGRRTADWVMPIFALGLIPFELLIAPLAFLSSGFARLVKIRQNTNPQIAETEVELMVGQRERSGALAQEPAELIRNVLEFSELTARDAMIPRKRMTAIKIDTPFEKVLEIVTETGHSRYPVYREDLDDILGLLYVKDLFRVLKRSWRPPSPESATASQNQARIMDSVREQVKYASETQSLTALLAEMRQDRQHMAIVVDEYGGTSGIVTLEDILEEIVGDIQDEFDYEEAPIVHDDRGRIIADAAVPLSDLSAYLGSELDPDGQYDSLGGMLTDKAGEVPRAGTSIHVDGTRFIIEESDTKHIAKVVIVRGSRADHSGPHSQAS
jgi:CBS domain containing-hemolysin-like protein